MTPTDHVTGPCEPRSWSPIPHVAVIGITGQSRHGKDTAARILLDLLPRAERFAFSDALSAYARMTGAMGIERDPAVLQELGWTLRGTGATLAALYGTIADKAPDVAVITGVRFLDEAAMIASMGGTILRVIREEPNGDSFSAKDRDLDHPVEREIAQIREDVIVTNVTGQPHVLQEQVTRACAHLLRLSDPSRVASCRTCLFHRPSSYEHGKCWKHHRMVLKDETCPEHQWKVRKAG